MPDAIESEHLPTQVGYDDGLQSGRDPDEDESMQMSFPEMVSDSLCRNSLVMQTDCCSSCPGDWSLGHDLGGEDAGCGVPGLVWLHVVCSCEAGWMYCQIL